MKDKKKLELKKFKIAKLQSVNSIIGGTNDVRMTKQGPPKCPDMGQGTQTNG